MLKILNKSINLNKIKIRTTRYPHGQWEKHIDIKSAILELHRQMDRCFVLFIQREFLNRNGNIKFHDWTLFINSLR